MASSIGTQSTSSPLNALQQENFNLKEVIEDMFLVLTNKEKDIIMLVHGGHGFKVLKKTEMIEVKQGPYNIEKDKVKFKEVDEQKIKIK